MKRTTPLLYRNGQKRSNKTKSSAQEVMKMKTTIRVGDLIAILYDEAKKETKDKRMQSVLVGLAFHDLMLRYGISKKGIIVKKSSAA
jgi:sorbitol-specific phosphotransferase system component IIBC